MVCWVEDEGCEFLLCALVSMVCVYILRGSEFKHGTRITSIASTFVSFLPPSVELPVSALRVSRGEGEGY